MDSLRWILLLVGAAIVAVIWWIGHRRSRERDESLFERARRSPRGDEGTVGPEVDDFPDFDIASLETGDREPVLDSPEETRTASDHAPVAAVSADTARADDAPAEPERTGSGPSAQPRADSAPAGEAERLEVVYVVAPHGERFVGSRLQQLFVEHGLQHGDMAIFHQHDAEGRALFSVANLVEPGTFDPATMDTLSTPGLALFVRLPGPTSAEIAFDRMIATARALAEALEGRVIDQQHSTLTRQTEQHLRDQMRAFDHRHQSARR